MKATGYARRILDATVPVTFPAGQMVRVLAHRVGYNRKPAVEFERVYLEALAAFIRPGMVAFDIGAEEGEFSAFAAGLGARVHLIEPAPTYWPNLRMVWEANRTEPPAGCWPGFFCAPREQRPLERVPRSGWPPEVDGPIILDGQFGSLAEHLHLPALSLDTYCSAMRARPDFLMIDVEGSEGNVLEGAASTLRTVRPVVFLSLHPPEWLAKYGWTHERLFAYMEAAGYRRTLLGIDHEEHLRFDPEP